MTGRRRVPHVWLLSQDLIFASRIAAAAEELGMAFRRVGVPDLESLPPEGGLLLIDLEMGIEVAREAVAIVRRVGAPAWEICGYGAHVDFEGLRSMREAGADRVVTRSVLSSNLEHIL